MSSVIAIGAHHRSAPLELLEKMAIDGPRLDKFLDDLTARPDINEAVILSTCNRTEIFVAAERFHGAYRDVRDFISDLTFLPPVDFVDHLDVTYDEEAVRHLFGIASGADSVVVGESEILGQVREAWDTARRLTASGPVLNLLFRRAVEVGKLVRTETAISRHVTSVSHAAVLLAADHPDGIADRDVTIVGAGSMARGVVDFVRREAPRSVTIVNRSPDNAADLVADGERHLPLSELNDALSAADLAFFATSSPVTLVTADEIEQATAHRSGRPLRIIDVAMPRDVDSAVGAIEGVTLLDMDDLAAHVEAGRERRRSELPAVAAILDAEVDRFLAESSAREIAPLVVALRRRIDDVIDSELDRHGSRLAGLDDAQRDAVDAVIRSSVAKMVHQPTVQLKSAAGTPRGQRLAATLRELFDI